MSGREDSRPEDPVEIASFEEWDAITNKTNKGLKGNLNIIDVYAQWCGPCKCASVRARDASRHSETQTSRRIQIHTGGADSGDSGCLGADQPTPCDTGLGNAYRGLLHGNDEVLEAWKEVAGTGLKFYQVPARPGTQGSSRAPLSCVLGFRTAFYCGSK